VASKEAVEYIKAFYRHQRAGKAEALRLARRDIRARHPNAYY